MFPANRSSHSFARIHRLALLAMLPGTVGLFTVRSCAAQEQVPSTGQTISVDQVRPGMQGYAFTIFAGDQVEKFDLEVIGVMPNFLGPKQSIILVQLKGTKVDTTGVVAGMRRSPVYIEGKLAGALSLKLGIFTKEPLAGVTPIEDMFALRLNNAVIPAAAVAPESAPSQLALPAAIARNVQVPSNAYLQPIQAPLAFSGFQPEAVQRFAGEFERYSMVATQGGTAPAQPDDAKITPGDMVGMVLVQGDASISAACTVAAVRGDRVFLCGHPLFGFGSVQLPMARSRVLTTLSSELASTKIVNVGGPIGTITDDRLTAVAGKLGATPRMIPMDLTVASPAGEKQLHFELIQHPHITPLLVAIPAVNGLVANPVYGEARTIRLSGAIS